MSKRPFLPTSPKVGFGRAFVARWHDDLGKQVHCGHGSDSFLVNTAALLDVRGIDEPHTIGIGVGGNTCCSGRILEDPVAENRVVIRGLEDMG